MLTNLYITVRANLRTQMPVFMPWVEARLSEKSTWFGMFTMAATLTGVTVAPAQAAAIALLGSTAASVVCVLTKAQPTNTVPVPMSLIENGTVILSSTPPATKL